MATEKRTDADAGFSAEEKAAMKERAAELRRGRSKDPEADVLEKIAEMEGEDQKIAGALHALVKEVAPHMGCKTWYGFPAYTVDKKNIFFFQPSKKFGTRYSTLGFQDDAKLDDGDMWPSSFAIMKWTPAVEKKITELIRQALG